MTFQSSAASVRPAEAEVAIVRESQNAITDGERG